MSNSSLVAYTKISPNRTSGRTHTIDTITIHCVVGQCSVETLGNVFAKSSLKASSNYGIGKDGRVGMYVEEKDRSWCSSSSANDNRAVTIECASDTYDPYAVNDTVYASLIKLVADICRRNGIKKLVWSTDKNTRVNHLNGCNMTVHRDYANKSCVPTYSEVLTRNGWVKIGDIQIGDEIACADIDNLHITFEEVYDKVPIRQQDTYTNNGITATKDHRMVYRTQRSDVYRIDQYRYLLENGNQIYIPLAGYAKRDGMNLSDDMIRLMIAVQADGHYMYDKRADGTKSYYGLEFHLKKERKIERIKEILESCHFNWHENKKGDGSVSIRVYNEDGCNIVQDVCEKYLHNKAFTWDWLELSEDQAGLFLDEIQLWDGCLAANLYTSTDPINVDVVSAIAALNGVGSRAYGNNVQFRDVPFNTLSKSETKRHPKCHQGKETEVTCVSVKTGIFLMRQHGKTIITGNCPGDYLYNRMGDIAAKVNALLGATATTPTTTTTTKTEDGKVTLTVNTLKKGSTGNQVKTLQRILYAMGYTGADGKRVSVDGDFGANTEYAVKKYQSKQGLTSDGIVGAATWGVLIGE